MVDRLPSTQGLDRDVVGTLTAPEIFFELVPNEGVSLGTLTFTLATTKWTALANGVLKKDFVAVAHLRCAPAAALALKSAIDAAILLATPPQSTDAAPEKEH